jgi:hypothetical protein
LPGVGRIWSRTDGIQQSRRHRRIVRHAWPWGHRSDGPTVGKFALPGATGRGPTCDTGPQPGSESRCPGSCSRSGGRTSTAMSDHVAVGIAAEPQSKGGVARYCRCAQSRSRSAKIENSAAPKVQGTHMKIENDRKRSPPGGELTYLTFSGVDRYLCLIDSPHQPRLAAPA